MKSYLPSLLCLMLLTPGFAHADHVRGHAGDGENCRSHGGKMDCDAGPSWCKGEGGICSPEMRGRCGKRRGDWYGARKPVASATEARALLQNYFSGNEYTFSDVAEKKWGFRADVYDRNGKVVDQVLIDKRSGRIRSLD